MSNRETKTIEEAGLEPEGYLVLHFGGSFNEQRVDGESVRTKDSELWFFEIADVSNINYSPIRLRDNDGEPVGPVEPEEGVTYSQLFDESGRDILRNNDNAWRIYHFSLGVMQDDIRVYPRIPESQNGGGWDWMSGSEPRPEEGQKFGFIDGDETSFKNPSSKLESFVFEQDSLTQTQFGFFNENKTVAREPILSVRGFAYELRPVHEEDDQLEILADISSSEGSRDNNVALVSYAKNNLRPYSFSVPSEWRSAGNTLTISKANTPSEIRSAIESMKEENIGEIEDVGGDE